MDSELRDGYDGIFEISICSQEVRNVTQTVC
jgi:hypothetical protein